MINSHVSAVRKRALKNKKRGILERAKEKIQKEELSNEIIESGQEVVE